MYLIAVCFLLAYCDIHVILFITTVPDVVDSLNATPFGVTCINVTWSGPSKLNGPPENRIYFVTVSGDSSGSVTTYNAGDSTSLAIYVNPGEMYEVKVCSDLYIHTCM